LFIQKKVKEKKYRVTKKEERIKMKKQIINKTSCLFCLHKQKVKYEKFKIRKKG